MKNSFEREYTSGKWKISNFKEANSAQENVKEPGGGKITIFAEGGHSIVFQSFEPYEGRVELKVRNANPEVPPQAISKYIILCEDNFFSMSVDSPISVSTLMSEPGWIINDSLVIEYKIMKNEYDDTKLFEEKFELGYAEYHDGDNESKPCQLGTYGNYVVIITKDSKTNNFHPKVKFIKVRRPFEMFFQMKLLNVDQKLNKKVKKSQQIEKVNDIVDFGTFPKDIVLTEETDYVILGHITIKFKAAVSKSFLKKKSKDKLYNTASSQVDDISPSYFHRFNYGNYTSGSVTRTQIHDSKKETGYVGLYNQGATCYMNSMLEALFHLPAFRRLVYQMQVNVDDDIKKNIPLALQRLFAKMQLGTSACSTKELTTSFGWNTHLTFIQHDVQEFCRVLLDNLENKMKGTKIDGSIPNLFKGTYRSFVRCINVDYESSRIEPFYDLSMVVKNTPNLIESFNKFTEVEILEGANQYSTDEYGKQDAKLGTEFIEFPKVLQLHLGRFEYDYVYDTMTKINSRFEFPESIDLDPYLAKDADHTKSWVYDLYGVLVHHGSVRGGHYYAFLRTSTDPQWYKFNDSTVTKAKKEDAIEDNFGGVSSSSYTSSEKSYNGYLLIYVRRDDAENIYKPVSEDEIPQYLKDYVEKGDQKPTKTKDDDDTKNNEDNKVTEIKPFEFATKEIKIYDEKSIIANLVNNKSKFVYDKLAKPFKVEAKTTQKELYHKIAEEYKLDVEEFRLWKLFSTNGYVPYQPIEYDDEIFFSYDLFLQKKDKDEDYSPTKQTIVFLEYFDSTLDYPLQYIGSTLLKYGEHYSKLIPIVKAKLNINEDVNFLIFTDSNRYIHKTDFDDYIREDKIILIFQLDPKDPKTSTIQCNYNFITKQNIKEIIPEFELNESNEPQEDILDYSNVMSSSPKTVDKYLSKKDSQVVTCYNYFDRQHPIKKVSFPRDTTLINLKKFIAIALDIDYNIETDTLLLYKRALDGEGPDTKPIVTLSKTGVVRNEFNSPKTKNNQKIFYYFIKNVDEEIINQLNGIIISICRQIPIVEKYQIYYLNDMTINDIINDLISKNLITKDDKYRISKIGSNNFYQNEYKNDDIIKKFTSVQIRFDIITEEQQNINEENEVLVKVSHCSLTSSRTLKDYDPFYFVIKKDETTKQIFERLSAIYDNAQWIKKCRLMFGDAETTSKDFLKNDQIAFEHYEKDKVLIIEHPMEKKKSSYSYYSSYIDNDQSVKIYN
ncbi:Clan CA, family C19, ubiquitin hydrolase-like cysteine peptidase [Histomonas meleagridis]|uniref:Clan CA, family C19, ubiquitin hydrolase-like cysteine peptidase n=1 Tax=Histomonas meleagridis TaxID=135588 RepID=UPI003559D5B7|nr:Clan CA, family C19, ubiquitin hydrolase-like cysteine peptidase [Histomonas meleagridis]KAH0804324.1 Clan CA, family C19, ubiquitin hydrolase-like cysteine peptidase [Histomonas meleagridis]